MNPKLTIEHKLGIAFAGALWLLVLGAWLMGSAVAALLDTGFTAGEGGIHDGALTAAVLLLYSIPIVILALIRHGAGLRTSLNAPRVGAGNEAGDTMPRQSLFLAYIAHEIRTLMNATTGMTSLMLATSLDAQQRDYARTIQASGEMMLSLVNDILTYAKSDAGCIELEKQPFAPAGCIEDVFKLLAPKAAEKRVELTRSIDPGLPNRVLGDPIRVKQILTNLVDNGIKFAERGGVKVSVREGSRTDSRLHLEFAIADTGIGIAPENQKRLFQAFSQADSSVARKFGGTGLGLAICARLVELMGGEICVESVEGKGTIFRFSIAVEAVEQKIESPSSITAPGLTASGTPGASTRHDAGALDPAFAKRHPLHILVVDDNAINLKLTVRILNLMGYAPDSAVNGIEAVNRCREHCYDLVLMDTRMPEMDGLEATRRIRQETESCRRPRIVAMTANAFQRDRADCLAADMDDYLAKPVSIAEIHATLLRCYEDTVSRNDAGVVDAKRLSELKNYERQTPQLRFSTLLDKFIESVPAQEAEIKRCSNEGNYSELANAAHHLRGACVTMGAIQLANLCRDVENHASAADRKAVDSTVASLARISRLTVDALRRAQHAAA